MSSWIFVCFLLFFYLFMLVFFWGGVFCPLFLLLFLMFLFYLFYLFILVGRASLCSYRSTERNIHSDQ